MVAPAGHKKDGAAHSFLKHLWRETRTAGVKRERGGGRGEDGNPEMLTGVMTVRSGRWLPPAHGWLLRMTSPSFNLSPNALICTGEEKFFYFCSEVFQQYVHLTWYWTVSCMAPRWTGM